MNPTFDQFLELDEVEAVCIGLGVLLEHLQDLLVAGDTDDGLFAHPKGEHVPVRSTPFQEPLTLKKRKFTC